jgi:hypothetical protein
MTIDYLAKPVGFTIYHRQEDRFLQTHLVGPERKKLEHMTVKEGITFAIEAADVGSMSDKALKTTLDSLVRSEHCYFVIFDKTLRRIVGS